MRCFFVHGPQSSISSMLLHVKSGASVQTKVDDHNNVLAHQSRCCKLLCKPSSPKCLCSSAALGGMPALASSPFRAKAVQGAET